AIGLKDVVDEDCAEDGVVRLRTREEEEEREGAVQELLNQPRIMPEQEGIRRRQLSADAGQDIELVEGKEVSSPIQEMLRKGFGQVRRSLDVG
ncbi:MAG: hypothetical protein Q9177_006048, partial [Variospora cf. flavescens]